MGTTPVGLLCPWVQPSSLFELRRAQSRPLFERPYYQVRLPYFPPLAKRL